MDRNRWFEGDPVLELVRDGPRSHSDLVSLSHRCMGHSGDRDEEASVSFESFS